MKTMKKNMKIWICPIKPWKQRFLVKISPKFPPAARRAKWSKVLACGEQNSQQILRAKYEIFNKNLATSKFNLRNWTKNSINRVQKTMKTMKEKITMKMGKNNHENHEKLLKNWWEACLYRSVLNFGRMRRLDLTDLTKREKICFGLFKVKIFLVSRAVR